MATRRVRLAPTLLVGGAVVTAAGIVALYALGYRADAAGGDLSPWEFAYPWLIFFGGQLVIAIGAASRLLPAHPRIAAAAMLVSVLLFGGVVYAGAVLI